jgi:hypothetical protein
VSASASEQTVAMNDVFIVLLDQEFGGPIAMRSAFIAKSSLASPVKLFTFLLPEHLPFTS